MAVDHKNQEAAVSEIIALAWCDKTSFDAIANDMGVTEVQVIVLMHRHLKPSSFRLWRKWVPGRKAKHLKRAARTIW